MSNPDVFSNVTVIGEMPPPQVAGKLREVGEDSAADKIDEAQEESSGSLSFGGAPDWWPFQDRMWQYTAHAFGYIPPVAPGTATMQAIQYAGNMTPDATLKNSRIKITLDRLRVADYPGGGTHQVLIDFYAENQVSGTSEKLHFNATYAVMEGQQAGIAGYPIFVGLNVGSDGVAFSCLTINVKNDDDEKFLSFLDSDVFKSGLKLVTTAQPALVPFSQLALGITQSIAKRNQNVPVQRFYLGLDFGTVPTAARLAIGSYIAVQVPETLVTVWKWDQWVYNPNTGQIVNKANPTQLIPYNYVVFGVDHYAGE